MLAKKHDHGILICNMLFSIDIFLIWRGQALSPRFFKSTIICTKKWLQIEQPYQVAEIIS